MAVDGGTTPTFGYYAGPAARITGRSHGRTVTAHQATSTAKPDVQVYWFDGKDTAISGLTAYDAGGATLPAGNTGIGVG
jgi:hypothetical protein